MSYLEKRFNYHYPDDGSPGGVSAYTDDPRDIARADREYGGVRFVTKGYADITDHPGGTEYVRRTEREVPREEWEHAAKVLDGEEKLVEALVRVTDQPVTRPQRKLLREAVEIALEQA